MEKATMSLALLAPEAATPVVAATGTPVLSVRGLRVVIDTPAGSLLPVGGVDLTIAPGATLGLVGESGCGKTLACLAVAGLLPPRGRIAAGSVRLDGRELVGLSQAALAGVRGRQMAMVSQDPAAALNPVMTIGRQVAEALTLHGASMPAARAEARRLLDRVGIAHAAARMANYPHELSGGMNQRAMIAMAIACRPRLLIADEPTTALDVTIQAQILDLLRDLQAEFGMALLLVTHDLGVVAEMADTVAVMYAGRVVEQAPCAALFAHPAHPYAGGLIACLPRIERDVMPMPIPGVVPPPGRLPPGCAFAPRCGRAAPECAIVSPPLGLVGAAHRAACLHPLA
jgi:peptide/nickel transport system ATP-binding protein